MIGAPVAQTRAPYLFNHRFAETDSNRVMAPLEVPTERLAQFIDTVRGAENCEGFVATAPHKAALVDLMDGLSSRAQALGLVNVVRRNDDGTLTGEMLDGPGFWAGAAAAGVVPKGRRIVLGGGGAAGAAIALSYAEGGGREIAHLGTPNETARLAALVAPLGTTVQANLPVSLEAHDMVINATPVGMAHEPGCLFTRELLATLPPDAMVADTITAPLETELLRRARALNLSCLDGNAMTRGQFDQLWGFLRLP